MHIKNGVKIYDTREDIEADYENFVKEWNYDVAERTGEHQSGLRVHKEYAGGLVYLNLHPWSNKMTQEGMKAEDIGQYRRTLKNQFIIIAEKNPYQEKELTYEEEMALFEEREKNKQEYARINGRSEAEIEAMTNRHREYFSNLLKKRYARGKD